MSTWRWPYRLKLAEETKAPFGVGSYRPGVILLVGEQSSDTSNRSTREHRPFCSDKGCSGWLNNQLELAMIPESMLFWVNALYNDDSVVDLKAVVDALQPRQIIALGNVAKKHLTDQGVRHIPTYHPQYWKRFRSKDLYPLIPILKKEVQYILNTRYAFDAKASYRTEAQKLTWEEKVESIERMRVSSQLARTAMKRTLDEKASLDSRAGVDAGIRCNDL